MVDGGSLENCCTATYRGFESLRLRNPKLITGHMKRFFCILFTCAVATLSWGQSAQEIVARMDEAMNQVNSDNVAFTMDMKIPIVGTVSSRATTWGGKTRMEIEKDGKKSVSWIDGDTEWNYDSEKNEVEIKPHETVASTTESSGDMSMFTGITEGYNVSLKKQTADAWYIRCKKSKSNQDKSDPKTMDLVVAKDTYMPLSLSAKMSMVKVTLRDVDYNITEEMVTFDPAKYPTATIIDKR